MIKEVIHFEGKQDLHDNPVQTVRRCSVVPEGRWASESSTAKNEEIKKLLEEKVSKSSIAKIVKVSWTALLHFVRSRKIDPGASQPRSRKYQA